MVNGYYDVRPLPGPLKQVVEVPGSKSITNRALFIAALAEGEIRLEGALFSDDAKHFLDSLKSLGFQAEADEAQQTVTVRGEGGRIPRDHGEIYVGSAGTAARFLTAMLGLSAGTYRINASDQMKRRPMRELFEVLQSLGAGIEFLEEDWHLPVRIRGAFAGADRVEAGESGKTVAGAGEDENKAAGQAGGPLRIDLDISESTQYLSALLMIAPMVPAGLEIRITSAKKTGSYIEITRKMMADFGVSVEFDGESYTVAAGAAYKNIRTYVIEPDLSAACYFYGLAAVTGSEITVRRVRPGMMQGDRKFLDVLCRMGCLQRTDPEGITLTGPEPGRLLGISLNMNDFSDQALTLAAIAPYADSPVEITGIAHIRGQECDRLHAISRNLTAAGIRCEEGPDFVRIWPGTPQPCEIETYEDHRVAMAFSLLGLRAEGIRILDPECCRKTFPGYFSVLDGLY